ncbi:GtrA family protein [Salinifilum ghardaiensis]
MMAQDSTGSTPRPGGAGTARGRGGRYRRLVTRFAAASLLATAISQLVFLSSYALGAAPAVATVLAQISGAVPNFLLNRRTWGGGGRGALGGEVLRFALVSAATAVVAALATSGAEVLAVRLSDAHAIRVAIVWSAFAGTYAAMFVVKFLLIDHLVFPGRRAQRSESSTR